MTAFELSRKWFDFAFENKEAKVQHTAIFLWIVELNNRLGWKSEFGLPTHDTMEGLSIGNKNTYLSALRELEKWGFIKIVKESKNQYQANIISICRIKKVTALRTALDTALIQHSNGTGNGIGVSIDPIDKQVNKETKLDSEARKKLFFDECKTYLMIDDTLTPNEPKLQDRRYPKEMLRAFYNYWSEKSLKGEKLRFESEKTFEIPNRLATWYNRDKAKYDSMYAKKLPENWWNIDLTDEQMKLVPADKLAEKKRQDVRRKMGI